MHFFSLDSAFWQAGFSEVQAGPPENLGHARWPMGGIVPIY